MLYSKKPRLDDLAVELAARAPITVKALHERLASAGEEVTLRAVYKAVDHLLDAGVLVKAGKRVRVDEEWVRTVSRKLVPPLSAPLGEGEKAAYTFTSIAHLDAFWKTIVLQLEAYERDGQVFFYNPHNFWAYMPERRESEEAYYRHFLESKIHAFFTIGGDAEADKEFKRAFQSDFLQVDSRDIGSFPRTNHLTILGDFIITVRIPKGMAKKIDELYATDRPIADVSPDLLQTCTKPGNIRFVLEHNPLKARKLKRMLSLNFYFKMT